MCYSYDGDWGLNLTFLSSTHILLPILTPLQGHLWYLPSLLICSFSYSIVEDIKRKIRFIHPNLIYSLHFFLASTRLVGLRNEILPHSCECHFDYHLSSLFWHPYSLYSLRARGSSFFLCLFQRLLK